MPQEDVDEVRLRLKSLVWQQQTDFQTALENARLRCIEQKASRADFLERAEHLAAEHFATLSSKLWPTIRDRADVHPISNADRLEWQLRRLYDEFAAQMKACCEHYCTAIALCFGELSINAMLSDAAIRLEGEVVYVIQNYAKRRERETRDATIGAIATLRKPYVESSKLTRSERIAADRVFEDMEHKASIGGLERTDAERYLDVLTKTVQTLPVANEAARTFLSLFR